MTHERTWYRRRKRRGREEEEGEEDCLLNCYVFRTNKKTVSSW
jgi:hypothetical protein